MAQIGYTMIGTNDLDRASMFYDQLLSILGASRFIETDRGISWSFGPGSTSLAITKPYDNSPASVGNGVMVALGVENREIVNSLFIRAMELGATSEVNLDLVETVGSMQGISET